MYDPTDQNKNSDGSPRDILGREVKYNCNESACSNRKRRMGYKACNLGHKQLLFSSRQFAGVRYPPGK